ncbi:MAG: aspartyl/asparaginyl beta-hydroxylase domain-containing protein [Gammaproteobacteria bacterium]
MNSQITQNPVNAGSLVEDANKCVQTGQLQQAAHIYARLLKQEPGNPDALNFFGTQALTAGQFSRSLDFFQRAISAHPDDAALHKNLGLAYRAQGALDQALAAFDAALKIKPDYPVALLQKSAVLEQLGRRKEAINGYLVALSRAGDIGLMAQRESLPAGLRQLIDHAIAVVQQARGEYLTEMLAPLRAKHGAADFTRVDRCLSIYLGKEPMGKGDPLQRCTFMTFPDIPAHAWFKRERFPWLAEIEKHTDEIRAELLGVLRGEEGFRPFIEMARNHPGTKYWESLNYSPNWNAFFFYRDGRRFDENCKRCPVTASLLDSLPLNRVAEHSPETFFSVLKPGAHIPPHTGVINTRLVVHLPLIIPPDCGIRVGAETRGWQEGECIVFDDTFEHEAWNKSNQTRVVLIFDIWNPYLTGVEREAMRIVVEELGHFSQLHGQSGQAYEPD